MSQRLQSRAVIFLYESVVIITQAVRATVKQGTQLVHLHYRICEKRVQTAADSARQRDGVCTAIDDNARRWPRNLGRSTSASVDNVPPDDTPK